MVKDAVLGFILGFVGVAVVGGVYWLRDEEFPWGAGIAMAVVMGVGSAISGVIRRRSSKS